MGTELLLGVRVNLNTLTTIKLSDVNLKSKVKDLKKEIAGRINLPKDSVEFIYCGCILEDDLTLESCGLKNGSMVHVLKKKKAEIPTPVKYIPEETILHIATVFKLFNENFSLRSVLHRLSRRPDVIENIISSSPGLYEDSIAIAILQDPDLMAHFTDIDTIRRIAELHPVLIKAVLNVAMTIHDESRNNTSGGNTTSLNSQPTAYSYSLDNLSDDEEMAGDSSQSSDSAQTTNLPATSSNTAITTAQLAAALSRARSRGLPISNSTTSSNSGNTNTGVITSEMFTQAMQQAIATAPTPSAATSPLPPILPPVLPQITNLHRQLAQMHEMGLQDDTVNIQALQFTNGDVQEAIELVFSGFGDN